VQLRIDRAPKIDARAALCIFYSAAAVAAAATAPATLPSADFSTVSLAPP